MTTTRRLAWLQRADRYSPWHEASVVVAGLGSSGFAAADALLEVGARVIVVDDLELRALGGGDQGFRGSAMSGSHRGGEKCDTSFHEGAVWSVVSPKPVHKPLTASDRSSMKSPKSGSLF